MCRLRIASGVCPCLLPPLLEAEFCHLPVYARLAHLLASGDSPVSASRLFIETLGLQACATVPGFTCSLRSQHSVPHTCVASAFTTEPSPLHFHFPLQPSILGLIHSQVNDRLCATHYRVSQDLQSGRTLDRGTSAVTTCQKEHYWEHRTCNLSLRATKRCPEL